MIDIIVTTMRSCAHERNILIISVILLPITSPALRRGMHKLESWENQLANRIVQSFNGFKAIIISCTKNSI